MIPARSSTPPETRSDVYPFLFLLGSLLILLGLAFALLDLADALHLGRAPFSPLGVLPLALGAAVTRRAPRRRASDPPKAPAPARFSIAIVDDHGAPQDLIDHVDAAESGRILRGPVTIAEHDAMLAGVEGLGGRERAA
jgi:hypothetical protein